MIEGLNNFVKELSPLKNLEDDDIFRFGEYAAVKDVSIFSYDFENKDIPYYNYKIIAHRILFGGLMSRKYRQSIYNFYWKIIPDEILKFIERNRDDIEYKNFASQKLILPQLKCLKSDVFFYREDGKLHFCIFGAEII